MKHSFSELKSYEQGAIVIVSTFIALGAVALGGPKIVAEVHDLLQELPNLNPLQLGESSHPSESAPHQVSPADLPADFLNRQV